jgi:hypothetical protein
MNKAIAAFEPSKNKVISAMFLLPVLKTLVAPIFPDPISRMSPLPLRCTMIKPNGIDPSK